MARYSITFARSARKELERLGEPTRTRVFRRIERLVSDPGHVVDISAVRHRSDVYR